MKNRIEIVENLLLASVSSGDFSDLNEAEEAVKAWLQHRSPNGQSIAPSLKGDMTEEGDAEYQDQAMRSVDA
ncbi:hypothetical protein [Allohahella marinimesophila]|uniref:Uncharacterized protein n=1 Tax=Allohahella marinimesophila TaxID=1054972 RepID=A0ABP7NJS4_9GAMM